MRDIVSGARLKLLAEDRDILLGRGRPDQHAIAARSVHFLDHEVFQIVEHIGQRLGFRTAPCFHVFQKRALAGVEFDDLGHVAVNCLVVGNPRARRVGDGDPARAIDIHDPRHAKRAFRVEVQRVEEIVIDTTVKHVDRFVACGGAHRDAPVNHAQIVPFDKLHPHCISKEGMFVIGRIVDARRQHRDDRIAGAGRGRASRQRPAQFRGIILHRLHAVLRKQFGEHLEHRLAVFQHVADARRRACVVLKHVELARAGAHKVDAHNIGIDTARRLHPDHLRQEGVVAADHFRRNAPRLDDLLRVVDVVQEGVDRAHPLFDAARQAVPLCPRNDARDNVKRDQPFFGLGLAIDVEGDAGEAEQLLGLALLVPQAFGVFLREPAVEVPVRLAKRVVRAPHFIKADRCIHICAFPKSAAGFIIGKWRGCSMARGQNGPKDAPKSAASPKS